MHHVNATALPAAICKTPRRRVDVTSYYMEYDRSAQRERAV